jgi:hypothetical protein
MSMLKNSTLVLTRAMSLAAVAFTDRGETQRHLKVAQALNGND